MVPCRAWLPAFPFLCTGSSGWLSSAHSSEPLSQAVHGVSYLSPKPSTYHPLPTRPGLPCLRCPKRLLGSCWRLKEQKAPWNLCDCLKGSFQRYTNRQAGCIDDCSSRSFFRSRPRLPYNKGIHLHKHFIALTYLSLHWSI